ncbi:unnamed protein product [Protopolystoma xenopodis]|uniref:Uncharacterized protein n=1 Tax=Protopolystoma xenopodis TaxID=117903 RepID=A0A448X966_9PLAT|nr:unnamed protein product [Protopolystoma xenopodis]
MRTSALGSLWLVASQRGALSTDPRQKLIYLTIGFSSISAFQLTHSSIQANKSEMSDDLGPLCCRSDSSMSQSSTMEAPSLPVPAMHFGLPTFEPHCQAFKGYHVAYRAPLCVYSSLGPGETVVIAMRITFFLPFIIFFASASQG